MKEPTSTQVKHHWLGPHYEKQGTTGNDITKTNVPDIRVAYRHETMVDELSHIFRSVRPRDFVTNAVLTKNDATLPNPSFKRT